MGKPSGSYHTDSIIRFLYLAANLQKLCADGFQMLGNYIFNSNIALCHRCSEHERTSLNLVRNNRILRAVQLFHTLDTDNIRSCALDIRTHAVQKVCKVNDMRLFCRIFDNRLSFCHNGSHHNVNRRAYCHHIHIDMAAL